MSSPFPKETGEVQPSREAPSTLAGQGRSGNLEPVDGPEPHRTDKALPKWRAARHFMDNVRFLLEFMLGGVQGPEVTTADLRLDEPEKREAPPFYYGLMFAQGRDFVAAELQSDDPFRMSGTEIVARVLAAGYGPDVGREQRRPFPTTGRLETVDCEAGRFLVAVDPVAETMSVQEVRTHRREPAKQEA